MKRADDVYFFTLIDFLLQVLFFGLVLYAYQATRVKHITETGAQARDRLDQVVRQAGVADVAELSNELTHLVPAGDLRALRSLFDSLGGVAGVRRMRTVADSAGGRDSLGAIVHRYRTGQDGYGKPPCNRGADGRGPANVAIAVGMDSVIVFEAQTAALDSLLLLVGRPYASVRRLRFAEFRRVFGRLPNLRSECDYWLGFRERTNLGEAQRTARGAFHLNYLAR